MRVGAETGRWSDSTPPRLAPAHRRQELKIYGANLPAALSAGGRRSRTWHDRHRGSAASRRRRHRRRSTSPPDAAIGAARLCSSPARPSPRRVAVFDKRRRDQGEAASWAWRASAAWRSRSMLAAVRGVWRSTTAPTASRTRQTTSTLGVVDVGVEHRGVHGDLRRRRYRVRRRRSIRAPACFTPERRRAEPAAQRAIATTSATSGSWRSYTATPSGEAGHRCGRGRTCS